MVPSEADVTALLAAWQPKALAQYRPKGVSTQTFDAALKELFVAIHRNPAAPEQALDAHTVPQDVLEVALDLRRKTELIRAMRKDLAAIAKRVEPPKPPVPAAHRARAAQIEDHGARHRRQSADRTNAEWRGTKAAELDAQVRELRDRQSERSHEAEQSYSDRRQRACSWLAKALRVPDPVTDLESRFIFSWIALNALYGVPPNCLECVSARPFDKLKQGHDDLLWFADTICRLDSDEKRIWSLLDRHAMTVDEAVDSSFLLRDYWISEKASDAELEKRKLEDEKKIIAARIVDEPLRSTRILKILLASRLRTLRNQFIHGAATDGPYSRRRENDEESFRRQVDLLEELVSTFLVVMKEERPIQWPCIPDPRFGSPAHRRRATSCPLNVNQDVGRRARPSTSAPRTR